MTKGFMKIVNFEMCNTCKNKKKSDKEKPCSECIAVAAREETSWPLYYERDRK